MKAIKRYILEITPEEADLLVDALLNYDQSTEVHRNMAHLIQEQF